jgi:DNA-binding NtrC family response regulator
VLFSGQFPAMQWRPLVDGRLRIGRGPELGLVVDRKLSREHGEIAFDGARWSVRDLNSRNGTFVDGLPVKGEVVLESIPRVVRMGHSLFHPRLDGYAFAAAAPARQGQLIIGPTLGAALSQIERAAAARRNVLITGESGSGKEIAAKAFHAASAHAKGPLISVNCAAIPQGLAERLLFGARRGAYSGASSDVDGYVQSAEAGVLFLDELGELDLEVQAKLLRVLETKEVLALGATQARPVNVRYCFATHRDLRQAVADGRFRADLFYRIAQPEIALPPLRERLDEIAWHICEELSQEGGTALASAEFVEACILRPWPGNVRELRAEVRRAAHALANGPGRTLHVEHLGARAGLPLTGSRCSEPAASGSEPPAGPPGESKRRDGPITREQVERALAEQPNASAAARALGIHRSHLYRLLRQLGVERPLKFEDD